MAKPKALALMRVKTSKKTSFYMVSMCVVSVLGGGRVTLSRIIGVGEMGDG